jgi:hypothetical protein
MRRRAAASVDRMQLVAHEPRRDVIPEFDPEPGWRTEHGRQWLDQNHDADGVRRDCARPERFDEAHLSPDLQGGGHLVGAPVGRAAAAWAPSAPTGAKRSNGLTSSCQT